MWLPGETCREWGFGVLYERPTTWKNLGGGEQLEAIFKYLNNENRDRILKLSYCEIAEKVKCRQVEMVKCRLATNFRLEVCDDGYLKKCKSPQVWELMECCIRFDFLDCFDS